MLRTIRRIFNTAPKKVAAGLVVAILAIAVPAVVMASYGPGRPTYDYTKYDPSKSCLDPSQAFGRCGSVDGPVFNSFINTPTYGDERDMTRIAEVVAGQGPVQADFRANATATPGKTYWVRTFVHNDANQNLNGNNFDGISVAHGTRLKVDVASGVSNGVDVVTTVSASNAKPGAVWGRTTLSNANQAFSVNYIPGSATIYNSAHQTGMAVSDDVTSSNGTPIGYNTMNGDFPGCFDFSAYIYVKVQVKSPQLQVNKVARVAGTNNGFQDSITAKKAENIQWRINFKDTGLETAKDVTIRDTLPAGVTLVPGTIKVTDPNRTNQVLPDNALNAGGVDLGNYGSLANSPNLVNGYVTFETSINKDFTGCTLKNVAYGRAQNVAETHDDSTVTISDCTTPPKTPIVSCDLLKASSLGNREFQFTLTYTVKNATFKRVNYTFGDGTSLLTDKTTVKHTYVKDGNFAVSASVTFMVAGKEKTVTSDGCKTMVSSSTPPKHCTLPGKENLPENSPECVVTVVPPTTTPTTLIDTGPGDVIGIFAGTSAISAVAYYLVNKRRLAAQK